MKTIKLSYFYYFGLAIALIAMLVNISISNENFDDPCAWIKSIPTGVTAISIAMWFFIKWGWKWRGFRHWLVPFPNLSGTYEGKIKSTWINPDTGLGIDPIPSQLVITQNFLNVHVLVYTGETISNSCTSSFLVNDQNDKLQLIYSYSSEPDPDVRKRSPIHFGTAKLDIHEDGKKLFLQGCYWTDRNTTGQMEYERKTLTHRKRDSKLKDSHPVSGNQNKSSGE